MEDYFEDLYDEPKRHDDDEQEPSFSFYDFKKWLAKQKKPKELDNVSESVQKEKKEELKNKFKERFKDRVRKRRKKED